MFTLYRIVKRSVAESVPDMASVHTRNAVFEAVSALEQYCSAPLLKVEHSVSDTGATFETEQKPIRYSVNIALIFCHVISNISQLLPPVRC